MNQLVKHCAVYTRKSSEEGLDQSFNSLDAQREACLAYITSQKAEGWAAVKAVYDDGGFSGGNIERPGLKKLLEDIKAGKVNIIVVYKIDRLTRSLMDFAKLVELFDQHQVTFVSVTQSFNTTTSMGRLTLNVLLSFAQFEREVTGERIRDKIAASKKKGMWMGGNVPLGYDLKDRNLIINEKEEALVQKIFKSYLKIGSVIQLKELLDRDGDKTKSGNSFTRGMLYFLLANPLYIGKIKHKTKVYDGSHKSIISEDIWIAVQKSLADKAATPRGQKKPFQEHLLRGLLFDDKSVIYSPVFTNKNGQRYRYYVSQNKIQQREMPTAPSLRIPAQEIEKFIEKVARREVKDTLKLSEMLALDHEQDHEVIQGMVKVLADIPAEVLIKRIIGKIIVRKDEITIQFDITGLASFLREEYGAKVTPIINVHQITAPFCVGKSWHGAVVIRPPASGPEDIFDLPTHDLRDLIRGIIWRDEHFNGMTIREIAKRDKRSDAFVGGMIRKTFEIA